jgi:hypothetical protein
VNQGTATYTEDRGVGSLVQPSNTSKNSLIVRSAPSAPFTVTAKIAVTALLDNYHRGGLALRESASGKLLLHQAATEANGDIEAWAGPTTYTSSITSNGPIRDPGWIYQRFVVHAVTNVDVQLSRDGVNWVTLISGYNLSSSLSWSSVDQVGLFAQLQSSSSPTAVGCSWLRVR